MVLQIRVRLPHVQVRLSPSPPLSPLPSLTLLPCSMGIATRTILFNTYDHLGRNAAILLAWIVLSLINITLITVFQRRRAGRAAQVEAQKQVEAPVARGEKEEQQ